MNFDKCATSLITPEQQRGVIGEESPDIEGGARRQGDFAESRQERHPVLAIGHNLPASGGTTLREKFDSAALPRADLA